MKILMFIPLFIIWGVLMYVFSRPYMKITGDEDFVFKNSTRRLFVLLKILASSALIVFWWAFGLGILTAFSLSQLGLVYGVTSQSQVSFLYKAFIIALVIPAIIMMILLAYGTRKLARQGHLTAGYADGRVNGRVASLSLLFMALEIGILFTITGYWASLSAHPKGLFGFVALILYIIVASFSNKIAKGCLKIILGKYLKTDYEPVMARGMEKYGITKEDFYRVILREKYPDEGEVDGK